METSHEHNEPVAWGDVKTRPDGKRYCRAVATTDQSYLGYLPLYTSPPPPAEPVAKAWDEGYRAGIDDERMSEENIGAAGFNAKIEPARNNPYRRKSPPAEVPLLSDEAIATEAEKHPLSSSEERHWYGDSYTVSVNNPQGAKSFARAIEQLVRRRAGLK